MISRSFLKGDASSTALYSDCERYRYALTRIWAPAGRRLLYIMLNPSTATEEQNDPTIERCERRARSLGYGGFRASNIFALRETDPDRMRQAADPVGPDNDSVLAESCRWSDVILCAWGAHGDHRGRGAEIERMLRATGKPLHSLGLTRQGHPRHPLYVGYGTRPEPWVSSMEGA